MASVVGAFPNTRIVKIPKKTLLRGKNPLLIV
jgi:hypothetical protein